MAVLQVIHGDNKGQLIPVEGERAVLGRHPECDIVLDVGAVSRQHAQILQVGREFFVEDLKSRNGTFVNGQMIGGRHRLQDHDRLKICDMVFAFYEKEPTPDDPLEGSTQVAPEAMMVDDVGLTGTTVMTTLDIQSSRVGFQMGVKPEVKLKALLEITRNLGSTIALDEVLRKTLDSLFKIFVQADRGFVVLRDPDRGVLIPRAVKHRRADQDETIRISRTIVNQVMSTKEAILSADAASDARFDTSQSIADFRIRSMMCAPLVDSEGNALGVIQVDTLDQRSRFQQDDLDVLASVACQAAIAVENSTLHERALTQKAIERDLDLAHQVQQGILPSAPPNVVGYEFFDFYEPANQVGGDFFDYVLLPGNRLGIIVADVAGKGIAAALLVAKLSSETRYCLVSEPDPAAAMTRLNGIFSRGGFEDRFVTMVMVVLDLEGNDIVIANAGHMAPLLRDRDGGVRPVGEEHVRMPLGVDADCVYDNCRVALAPADIVTLYTDGFNEAMDTLNEPYGIERLERVLKGDAPNVKALGDRILEDVKRFVGNRAQSDDMCLICFGRKME